jgi:hypothetical protein
MVHSRGFSDIVVVGASVMDMVRMHRARRHRMDLATRAAWDRKWSRLMKRAPHTAAGHEAAEGGALSERWSATQAAAIIFINDQSSAEVY